MTVLEVIQKARDERGITDAELSRRTGIEYQSLNNALKGKRGITGPELVSLCKELNLSISDFTEDSESEEQEE